MTGNKAVIRRPQRRGAKDMTRRMSDFATLGETGAIANEAIQRMREYTDGEINAVVAYLSEQRLHRRLIRRVKSWLPQKNSKPESLHSKLKSLHSETTPSAPTPDQTT